MPSVSTNPFFLGCILLSAMNGIIITKRSTLECNDALALRDRFTQHFWQHHTQFRICQQAVWSKVARSC